VKLDDLGSRRVALWGLGLEGRDMARLLAERGVVPRVVDDRPDGAAGPGAAGVGATVESVAGFPWSEVDVVVRSPGVSRYRPELAAAEAAGVTVTTAMAIWMDDFADARVVAVTGTKGKSTTAALAAALLAEGGQAVELIGNIGVPVTATYGRPLADAYVVEVSSYQAVDVTVTPGVCVLTSLAPDHLDWHGGTEAYYRDKLRLVEAGPPGALAVNAASDEAVRRTAGHPHRTLFGPSGRVRVTGTGTVEVDGTAVGDAGALRVPGDHNRWNLCGAVAATLLLDGRPPTSRAVSATIDGFDGLPSRCRTIGERDGVTYVDDALASNPFATIASLGSFAGRPITVILGGADRGVDPTELGVALGTRHPAPRVIVVSSGGSRLVGALAASGAHPAPMVDEVDDLADAVELARRVTPTGGVVLFSPAAPTPAGDGDYTARSRIFAAAAGLAPPGAGDRSGVDSRQGGGNGKGTL
jgi:UDP-N-acetylmuramoylalanine--D-glutamate ligase